MLELFRKEISSEFMVGEQELDAIYALLLKHADDVEINVLRLDDVSRKNLDLKDLFNIQNSKTTALREIKISARKEDILPVIEVIFDRSSAYSTGTKISITAPEKEFEHIRENLVDIIVGTRPWYHALYRLDFVMLSFVSLFLIIGFSYMSVMLGWVELNESAEITPNRRDELLTEVELLSMIGGILGVGYVLNKIRNIVFPRAVFLLGQEKSRYSVIEKTQWGVVISFIVGSLISIWQVIV